MDERLTPFLGSIHSFLQTGLQENSIRGNLRVREGNVEEEVIKYFESSQDFARRLGQPPFYGELDLGTDVKLVNWEVMPESVRRCFEPEFGFQPENITGFKLVSNEKVASNGGHYIKIEMERNRMWWSYLSAGLIIRRGETYYAPAVYARCIASEKQVKEAREAMEELNFWPRAATSNERSLLRHETELRITYDLLAFVETEFGKQKRLLISANL